jgi:hypothetical protein
MAKTLTTPAATPEVIAPARGRGRPRSYLKIVEERSPEERIQSIRDHHFAVHTSMAQAAMHAVLCGFELMAAKKDVGHGGFEEWIEQNCPFCLRTARNYIQCAERKYKQIAEVKEVSDFAIGVAPSMLDDPQRQRLIEAVKDSTDGITIQQMYLDLGVTKPPPKDRGGNAKLLSWLQDRYPEIDARREADLPADIRAEWQAQAVVRSDKEQIAGLMRESAIKFWHERPMELFQAADVSKSHARLPLECLEAAAVQLQTVREILLSEIRRRS